MKHIEITVTNTKKLRWFYKTFNPGNANGMTKVHKKLCSMKILHIGQGKKINQKWTLAIYSEINE